MGLLSIFQSKSRAAAAKPARAEPPADAVAQARTRARRRLIGAGVLVVIGVVGFPLLFETQPRPIPVDIPIEIPRKEGAPPLVMPAARQLAADAGVDVSQIKGTGREGRILKEDVAHYLEEQKPAPPHRGS